MLKVKAQLRLIKALWVAGSSATSGWCSARFGFFIGKFVSHQTTVARFPQYLEAPLSVEPRDSCLHQPYAFVRCMRVANGVNERLAVAYE